MLLDLSIRMLRRMMTPAFFVFILLVGVVGSLAFGLSEIINGLVFRSMFILSLISLVLGWWLASRRIHASLAALLVLVFGIAGMLTWVGNLLPPAVNITRVLVHWFWGYLRQQQDIIENITPLHLAAAEFSFAFNTILVDLQDWSRSLLSGNPVFIITVTLLVWGLAVWVVSAWAGWVQQRHDNVIFSVFPASLLLIAGMGYTWANISPLLPLLFCILMLLALTWLNINENRWDAAKIDYPVDARIDTLVAAIMITLVLGATAYFIPRISIRKIVDSFHEITNPQVEQAQPFIASLGIEASKPSIGRFGSMLTGGLPREHLIGSGPELSEQIVMTIQISGGLPPKQEAADYIPLYWRGLTYDQYTGNGWNSSDVFLRKYNPDDAIGVFERPGYWIIEQDVRFNDQNELLFSAGDLISADQKFEIAWRSEPWSSDIEQYSGDIFGALTVEQSYRANSFVPIVDETTLRETSFLPPDSIREKYIITPIITSQRVVDLTLSLIEDVHNPYDRAKIIEQYLRQFEYTTDLPLPPEDRDIADYFLFDLQKGYCDYFATTMVVMARAAYLPARLVIGYSRGTYDAANHRYVVTEGDAHSWPEIYFDGVGWVPFEPTSARKEIIHPEIPLEFSQDSDYLIEPSSLLGGLKPLFGSWLLTFGITAIAFIWFWMVWITFDEWRLKRQSPKDMVTRLYLRLYNYGRRLGIPASKQSTPSEFAESLQRQVTLLPIRSLAKKPMIDSCRAIERLTEMYVDAQYRPTALEDHEKTRILAIWQPLRRQLVLARGLFFARKLRRIKPSEDLSENLE